jgi:hypothetical protein
MNEQQKTTKSKYWIVEYYDEAVYGAKKGKKSETTVAGPFRSYSAAFDVKRLQYKSYRCTYYGIVQSKSRPKDTKNLYDFIDSKREFNDDN